MPKKKAKKGGKKKAAAPKKKEHALSDMERFVAFQCVPFCGATSSGWN